MTEDFRVHRMAAVAARRRQPRRNGPVQITRVHPEVWRAALRIAGGDAGRLVVLGPTAVVVANHSRYGARR
jgi:hypothetical protein